jgi:hypothetical protein
MNICNNINEMHKIEIIEYHLDVNKTLKLIILLDTIINSKL